LFLTCVFIVSRLWYYRLGVRFDASPLGEYLQYVDPGLLRHSLLESVFYLHGQPPLFNLFLGVVLKLFPTGYPAAFAAIYLALGLALLLTTYMLLVRTGVPVWLSAFIALVFSASPVTILYENWLFYAYPITVLVSLSVLVLQRYAERERRVDLTAFFVLVTLLSLTWAAFHLVWVAATVILVLLSIRNRAREIAVLGAASLLVVTSLYAKNYALFGTFGCGTIYPNMNLALMTTQRLPNLRRLARRGDISRTSLVPVGSGLAVYRVPLDDPTGIDVLDQVVKTGGGSNWHHIAYLEIADKYFQDARWVLREHPEIYLEAVRRNVRRYFIPASNTYPFKYETTNANTAVLKRSIAAFNLVLAGRIGGRRVGWHMIVAFPLAILCGTILLTRRGRDWLNVRADSPSPRRVTIAFCLVTVTYLFLVTALISAGDQNRYRYMATPCYLILLGQLATLSMRPLAARLTTTKQVGQGGHDHRS
jgi:hypothetical protein